MSRIASVVGGNDEGVPILHQFDKPWDVGIDNDQGLVVAPRVPAIFVDHIRVREVDEHERGFPASLL